MKTPFWFNVISEWKKREMGEYGITIPFLVGAISIANNVEADACLIINIFSEMKNNPVNNYYAEVRWCGNINEPVVCMKKIEDLKKVAIKGKLMSENQVSFGFTQDLMSMFNLNCTTPEECLEKLINIGVLASKTGCFSKNNGKFSPFTKNEIEFIKDVALWSGA